MTDYPQKTLLNPMNSPIIRVMKYELICEVCNKNFNSSWGNQKSCSSVCRNKRYYEITGRSVHRNLIPTGTVGAMSELVVAADLMKKGYSVFRALSPACFCDLIAIKNGKTFNIEVKTGYLYKKYNKLSFGNTIQEGAHYFGIYERNSNEIFYLDKKHNHIILD